MYHYLSYGWLVGGILQAIRYSLVLKLGLFAAFT
jgi:hypothetical protein